MENKSSATLVKILKNTQNSFFFFFFIFQAIDIRFRSLRTVHSYIMLGMMSPNFLFSFSIGMRLVPTSTQFFGYKTKNYAVAS